nr:MAG TPA: hypothetical protein [Caudoviricetes sp.]
MGFYLRNPLMTSIINRMSETPPFIACLTACRMY